MIKGGAGFAIIPMTIFTLNCFTVTFLCLKFGTKNITKADLIVGTFSFIAIIFWLFIDRPLVALIFAIAADLLAFIPTVRKTWEEPKTETLSMYFLLAFRFVLILLAVDEFTILSTLWLITWIIVASVFSVAIFFRRRLFAEI